VQQFVSARRGGILDLGSLETSIDREFALALLLASIHVPPRRGGGGGAETRDRGRSPAALAAFFMREDVGPGNSDELQQVYNSLEDLQD